MTEALVERTMDGAVATLTLNRPAKLNALTPAMFAELATHIDDLATRTDVSVTILTGMGRSFCAGHSLDAITSTDAQSARYAEAATIDALEALPMPTVAKIRGHCLTGGLELALGCDLLIGSESATFGDTHGQWGLVPVWGMSVRLPERVGLSRAKALSFTSRRIDGSDAAAMGLLDRCVPDDELDGAVALLADEIIANSAEANRIMKRLYSDAVRDSRTVALLAERELPHGLPGDSAERLARHSRTSR